MKICTYRFLGMPIAMHYVRTLCDKYFLSYDGFSWFLTGRFRHRVLKHGCRGRMGCKEDCCICSHSMLIIFNPILCYLSPKILIFQELLIIETWNKCHWIWHALNPKYAPLTAISMHFSQSKSTKCEIFAWNCDFSGTTYCRDSKPAPLDLACLKP